MNLYELICKLKSAKGSNEKLAIMYEHHGSTLFRLFMKSVYDVSINYYIKKMPAATRKTEWRALNIEMLESLSSSVKEGTAKQWFKAAANMLDDDAQELLQMILNRKIGAGVGDSMVLRTWPNLYFIPPYQRCSLMDDKIKAKFVKAGKFYVQTKLDGSFAYLVHHLDGHKQVITRQGNTYPAELAEKLCKGVWPGHVAVGELEVYEYNGAGDSVLLDRKTGNGMLNSLLHEGKLPEDYSVKFTSWDLLTEEEFWNCKSNRTYKERVELAKSYIGGTIKFVEHEEVSTLKEAYLIYSKRLEEGKEGCVIKLPSSLWKDGTATDIVKLKLKFEAEFLCTGMYEGKDKYKGTLGGLHMQSKCGKIVFNVGTGFSDKQRDEIWCSLVDLVTGRVITVSANDLIQSRDTRKPMSLSLPAFEMIRYDKADANTLEEVLAAKNAAIDSSCDM